MRSFIINDLEPIAYLLYMVALFLQYNRYRQIRYMVLFFYYFIAAIILYAGLILTNENNHFFSDKNSIWYPLSEGNNWSYNLLYVININFFSWFFFRLLHSKVKRMVLIGCWFLNVILSLYIHVVINRFFSDFNSYLYGVAFLTIVLYALFYLHQLLLNKAGENLLKDFDFLLICGYLLYYTGSFVVVIYYQNAEAHQRGNIWAMNNILLFICSILTLSTYFGLSEKQKLAL